MKTYRFVGAALSALLLAGCGAGGQQAATPPLAPFVAASDATVEPEISPNDTQARADKRAGEWAKDRKAFLTEWHYVVSDKVGFTNHFYYSKDRQEAIMIRFLLSKNVFEVVLYNEKPILDLGRKLEALKSSYPVDGLKARANLAKFGLVPGALPVIVLIDAPVLPPLWVFTDALRPVGAVNAETGQVLPIVPPAALQPLVTMGLVHSTLTSS